MGAAAGQSRSQDESTSPHGVDPAPNGGGGIGWGLPPRLVVVIGEGGRGDKDIGHLVGYVISII
jgi:hypothetical protein